MKEEDIRLIKQEIKNNRIAGECGLASNNEKFEWTKTADALEKLLEHITNLQEEKEMYKKEKDTLMNSLFITRNKYNNDKARYIRKAKNYKTRIYKAIKYINSHLKQDMLSDFTGASYIQEYIIEPDYLLNILQGEQNE